MYVFASLDRLSRTELISGVYGHTKKKKVGYAIVICPYAIGEWGLIIFNVSVNCVS